MGTRKGSKRGTYKPSEHVGEDGPVSALCEFCGVNAPARKDNGLPMQHYDGRVEKAWESQTYCNGKH